LVLLKFRNFFLKSHYFHVVLSRRWKKIQQTTFSVMHY
jgi:hypothetical protein